MVIVVAMEQEAVVHGPVAILRKQHEIRGADGEVFPGILEGPDMGVDGPELLPLVLHEPGGPPAGLRSRLRCRPPMPRGILPYCAIIPPIRRTVLMAGCFHGYPVSAVSRVFPFHGAPPPGVLHAFPGRCLPAALMAHLYRHLPASVIVPCPFHGHPSVSAIGLPPVRCPAAFRIPICLSCRMLHADRHVSCPLSNPFSAYGSLYAAAPQLAFWPLLRPAPDSPALWPRFGFFQGIRLLQPALRPAFFRYLLPEYVAFGSFLHNHFLSFCRRSESILLHSLSRYYISVVFCHDFQ